MPPFLQRIHWKIALPQLGLILAVLLGLWIFLSGFLRNAYVDTLRGRLRAECSLLAGETASRRENGATPAEVDA